MFDFIEKLRAKSDKEKRKFAFFYALSFSGIIFVLWLLVVYPNLGQNQNQGEVTSNSKITPASTLSDTIGKSLTELGDQFLKIKDTVSSFTKGGTSPEYYSASTSEANVIESYVPTSSISGAETEEISTTTGQ